MGRKPKIRKNPKKTRKGDILRKNVSGKSGERTVYMKDTGAYKLRYRFIKNVPRIKSKKVRKRIERELKEGR